MNYRTGEGGFMSIFIYFYSKLREPRDVFEDALDECLGGKGEVTGGGSGEAGSNIDIEIYEGDPRDFLEPIRKVLKELQVPQDTIIVIDKERFHVY
jgi:hypothetical protein